MLISHTTRQTVFDRVRRFFGGLPCRVQAAALPWRLTKDGVEVMLVTSRGTGRWVLPKGWPENTERLSDAALREAKEEAGLEGGVARDEIGRFYYSKALPNGHQWQCEVHVFPVEVDQVADKWPEMKKRRRQWFRSTDAAKLVSEPDLAELISGFGRNPRQFAL
jgi:8-oxo-dGTP pyrophosphatase MutT (NUDIX family)